MSLRSLIIDDEKLSRDLLRSLITEYCSEAEIIGEAGNVDTALSQIKEHAPDVIFLDIEMPGGNGFDLIKGMAGQNRFQTVFVTAYNQYAIQAIRAGAVDYLLKPVDIDELKTAVHKLYRNQSHIKPLPVHETNTGDVLEQTLLLPYLKGVKILKLKDIIHLEADNNYTVIHLSGGAVFVVSKSLKELEHKLDDFWFFRPHKSHIINFYHCAEYSSDEGDHAVMSSGEKIAISRLRLNDFFEALHRFSNR